MVAGLETGSQLRSDVALPPLCDQRLSLWLASLAGAHAGWAAEVTEAMSPVTCFFSWSQVAYIMELPGGGRASAGGSGKGQAVLGNLLQEATGYDSSDIFTFDRCLC